MRNDTPTDSGYYLDEYDACRFWAHVTYEGGTAHETDPLATAVGDCWLWNRGNGDGYGRVQIHGKWRPAHRIAYLDFGHKLPEGQVIDHLCRNRSCVRPSHLEAVSHLENVARGIIGQRTHCSKGHAYSPSNTHIYKRGDRTVRVCTTCRASRSR